MSLNDSHWYFFPCSPVEIHATLVQTKQKKDVLRSKHCQNTGKCTSKHFKTVLDTKLSAATGKNMILVG